MTHGATWGPCTPATCGKWTKQYQPSSNWQAAAEEAGNTILNINPRLLMFVEGVELPQPQGSSRG